jgi:hypothetical protein
MILEDLLRLADERRHEIGLPPFRLSTSETRITFATSREHATACSAPTLAESVSLWLALHPAPEATS